MDEDAYTVYDLENKVVTESIAQAVADPLAPSGDDQLTGLHIANFVEAIRSGVPLTQPIAEGAKSVLLCHLGNIAQWTGRALRTDPESGRILGDRSEERRVGKECRARRSPYHSKKNATQNTVDTEPAVVV